jgi:hypothetical protein
VTDYSRNGAASQGPEYAAKVPVPWIEILMLGLFAGSVLVGGWMVFFSTAPAVDRVIVIVGCGLCVIVAWVVLWRRRRVAEEEITAAVMRRSLGMVVNAVKRPVTIAVLEEVADVLRAGRYTRNIAAALEENRAELDAMILELIKNDPQLGRVRYLPFHEDIIRGIANASFRIVFQVLADPRIDELIGDVLRENVRQMRAAVRAGVYVPEAIDHKPEAGDIRAV